MPRPRRRRIAAACVLFCGLVAFFALPWSRERPPERVSARGDSKGRRAELSNGRVRARVSAAGCALVSLAFTGAELLGSRGGGVSAHVGRPDEVPRPARAGRGRVRLRRVAGGGVEAACTTDLRANRSLALQLDVAYALRPGSDALFVRAALRRPPKGPALRIAESRFHLFLNRNFTALHVDAERTGPVPAQGDFDLGVPLPDLPEARTLRTGPFRGRVEHKYRYSARLGTLDAWGWTSPSLHAGAWIANPSAEYLGGGPLRTDLTGHLDFRKGPGNTAANVTAGSREGRGEGPVLLDYFHSEHYGGGHVVLARDEKWAKAYGPFAVLLTEGGWGPAWWRHKRQARDAARMAAGLKAGWPFAWVDDPLYPPAASRASVRGRLLLSDPRLPQLSASGAWVGLVPPRADDWQRDAAGYQFWTRADPVGSFEIANVRPGSYRLVALADGTAEDYRLPAALNLSLGQAVNLRELEWTPRGGRILWQVGEFDRTAREFFGADQHFVQGAYARAAAAFPSGVRFDVGRGKHDRDWPYAHPISLSPSGLPLPTARTVAYELASVPARGAVLRVALCGSNGGNLTVLHNGHPLAVYPLPVDQVMHRDGVAGSVMRLEACVPPDRMRVGGNEVGLVLRGDGWRAGVLYDAVRMEEALPGECEGEDGGGEGG
ncbi:polysaccharide lyase family 4, domain III-domain-containing protein [Hyaloraphidium curvatum]|nr:polysaccharide lyase family 4, domain III-domain-containing protein [Hyaloraphidium curvatum]